MTYHVSSGLRNKMLDTGSLKSVMANGLIKIYSGPVPADADQALDPSCVLLSTISVNGAGGGINFDAASNGTIPKAAAESWSGTNAANGAASFYRHVAPGDDGTLSTTQARLQGAVAVAGAEMNLSSTALVAGAPQTIDYYVVAIPTL